MVKAKRLGDVVCEERTWQLWTQGELAKRAKVSESIVANIERGTIVSLRRLTAEKIGQALGVDLSAYIKERA